MLTAPYLANKMVISLKTEGRLLLNSSDMI
jgi:hypothetical protein